MTVVTIEARMAPLSELGERLAALRLEEPCAVEAMRCSLERHGQLSALVVFDGGGPIEVVDGFKRLRAARRLGWSELAIRPCGSSLVDAKVGLVALHATRGLSEIEEGWLVRSLYREHGMSQPEIGERLGRHKSWVCRRLMLVESLTAGLQASVRLGLVAPRAAVALAALPRGNQPAASAVVVRRGLTVRQTEQLCAELLACTDNGSRGGLLERWADGTTRLPIPGPRPGRALRSEAQAIATDIETVRRVGARLEARLLGSPLRAHGPEAAELLGESLRGLLPVLTALGRCIGAVTEPRVDWEGNRYAVPYDHVTDIVPVRITEHELFVYAADLECVARHELARRGSGLSLDPHGYHPRRRRPSRVDLDQLRTVFEAMGQGAQDFFRLLRATPTRLWAHHLRQILGLRGRYATSDLDAALGHAALYGAFDPRAVERIVAARSAPRTLDEYVAEETARRMAELLGERRTEPRDLSEYDRLPTCGSSRLAASSTSPTDPSPCPNPTAPAPSAQIHADEPGPLASPTTRCEPGSAPICPSSD